MDEILKIVLNRNKERKVLSTSDVRRICNIIIKLNNYQDFTIDFTKDGDNPNTAGGCYSDSIVFYANGITKFLDENYKMIKSKTDFEGCKVDIYNFFYLAIIFHEFAHVRQHRIDDFGYSSIEKTMFNISFRMMNLKSFYDVNDNYIVFPTEVNAYNTGYINAFNIYRRFPKEFLTPNDKNNYAIFVFDTLIDNYGIDAKNDYIKSPIEKFYEKADEYNVSKVGVDINKLKVIANSKHDITIYRKLMLGLPLSFQEYAYVNLIDDCIRAEQDIDFVKKIQKKL